LIQQTYVLPPLPPSVDFETVPILKAAARAHRALGELKGRAAAIPNPGILIDTLTLQEARASSDVENIVTTQDELFQADVFPDAPVSAAAKEVALYREALRLGYARLHETDGLILNSTLIEMFQRLKGRADGFRSTPGTALRNAATGEIVFVPPQDSREIVSAMSALERFVNDGGQHRLDPLVRMALIHHQFESIHPFPDGNGRIGRILNVLFLVSTGLLDTPILYLSRHVMRTKPDYYRLLQAVRDSAGAQAEWEAWIVYMLEGVERTAAITLRHVEGIRVLMAEAKRAMREKLPKLYSQELLNNLFRHPYTRIDYVQRDLGLKARQTAARYLDQLADAGFVVKTTIGRNNYYVNSRLVALFTTIQD
jgi:Fic family protein